MQTTTKITCLFLDIGGVLLTNGWDHPALKRAAATFKLASIGLRTDEGVSHETS